eukprot:Transcript_23280.p1 GENE.Transcript_23280~~Transcript_23280.p1  ORF type:complete len:246 (+),score=20.61 Transcript_23280:625-1362(+)
MRSCRPCGETSGTSVGTEVEVLMGEPYAEVSGELLSKSEPLTLRFGFTAGGSTRAPSGACPEYAAMMCCFRGLPAVMLVSSAPGGEVSAHAVPFGTAWAEPSPPGADDTSITAGNPRKQHIMAAYSGQAPDGALVLPPAVKPKRKVKGSDLLKSSPLTSAYGSPMRTSTSVPTLVPLVSPHGRHDRMPPVLDHKQAWQSPNSSAPNNDSSTERVAPHCENAACRVSLAHTAQWGSLVAAGRHGVV